MNESFSGYTFGVEDNVGPVAVITPASQRNVVGSIVKMDGRASFDRDDSSGGVLTYAWYFSKIPIGSQVENEGFQSLDPDDAVISFAPDIPGDYEVELVVSDGSLLSLPAKGTVNIQIIIVPNHQGLVPDASFIWNYLSDFWKLVEDRERFEVLWSASIQIVASELLKLWQVDYNKSIRDIQEVFQRRWLNYSPTLALDAELLTGILATETAGVEASTFLIDPDTCITATDQPEFFNMVTIPIAEGSFVTAPYNSPISTGRLVEIVGRSFTMSRSNDKTLATNLGDDGATAVGLDVFGGSSFETDQIGDLLKILTGADRGTYVITDVGIDGDTCTVENEDSSVVAFLAATTNVQYSVCPPTENISCLFADQKTIPTATANRPWRFLPTLQSTEYDFEAQGVSPGDLLEVEITREDRDITAILQVQVASVDRSRVGFTFNREDLIDGVSSGGITEEDQVALAEALQITGLVRDVNGVLQYSLEAELIRKAVTSVSWKRTWFELSINTETSVDIGPFTLNLKPTKIIRNSKIAVDDDLVSVPVLQEYIRQPDIAEQDGQLYIVSRNGGLHEVDHTPFLLLENKDYVLDDESSISGIADTELNVDEIVVIRGDLIDRSIRPGDSLTLQVGATFQTYDIRDVLSSDRLRVFPIPSSTNTNVAITITRRISGKFIRFTEGTFSKDIPCPANLWSELSYFNNNDNIEKNFGVLVGVRRDDIEKTASQAPYRSVVAGLMYALTTGPVVENLRLSSQILLGLPFAQNPGVVTEINPEYRLREDGSPLFGRILIEAHNNKGVSIGITNIYQYPHGRQLLDNNGDWLSATPNEAGLSVNPETGVEYVVGDNVAQFAVLSKGVEVRDYLGDPESIQRQVEEGTTTALITQYHSMQLRINADLAAPSDVNLTTEFIRKAKPHYIRLSAGLLKIIEDFVEIEDSLIFGRPFAFYDTISHGLPIPVKLDQGSGDDDYLTVEGVLYSRYVFGTDLATTQGSLSVSSATGGFIDAGVLQSFDSPLLLSGDLLVIEEGDNKGQYLVDVISTDTSLTVLYAGAFSTQTSQRFRVYRPVRGRIFQGTMTASLGSDTLSTASGTFSAGVAVGDVLTFNSAALDGSRIYTVKEHLPDTQQIRVDPAIVEASGTYTGSIWREALLTESLGNDPTDNPHTVDLTLDDNKAVFVPGTSDLDQLSFIRPDYVLTLASSDQAFVVVDFDPSTLEVWVSPPPSATSAGEACRLSNPLRGGTPITLELLDRIPDELLELELQLSELAADSIAPGVPIGPQDLTTTSLSDAVGTVSGEDFVAMGVKPGDFLVILEGSDANVDVGYGNGVFPIIELTSTTTMRLTRQLTVTNGAPGIRYGIRRRKVL